MPCAFVVGLQGIRLDAIRKPILLHSQIERRARSQVMPGPALRETPCKQAQNRPMKMHNTARPDVDCPRPGCRPGVTQLRRAHTASQSMASTINSHCASSSPPPLLFSGGGVPNPIPLAPGTTTPRSAASALTPATYRSAMT